MKGCEECGRLNVVLEATGLCSTCGRRRRDENRKSPIIHGTYEGFRHGFCHRDEDCPETPTCRQVWKERDRANKEAYFQTAHGRSMRQAREASRLGVWHVQYDFQIICAQYEYRCAYRFPGCEDHVRGEYMLTRDHVIPIYFGGPDVAFNILPACRSCNSYKKHRWLTYLPFDPYHRIADPNLLVALAAGPKLWTPKLLVADTPAFNAWLERQF
jgi:hypothetical protein